MEYHYKDGYATVAQGVLRGTVEDGMHVFRGVPYAAPPVGERRWRYPQPPAKWFGVRTADRLVGGALQKDMRKDLPFEDFELGAKMDSEDCLYLNLYSPAVTQDEKLPVLVWVHGGGMVAGTGMAPFFEGERLAAKGFIVVTINYRLGLYGFFCHPELSAESPHAASGNYALMDIREAVLWLRENVAAFGGDPNRITVGGQSGGSVGTSCLLLSPLMRSLICGVILESGCPVMGGMMEPKPLSETEREGADFADAIGCRSLAELRALDGCDLINLAFEHGFVPNYCVDGHFLPDAPDRLAYGGKLNPGMAVLVGATSEEFGAFGPAEKADVEPKAFEAYIRAHFPQQLSAELLSHYPHSTPAETLRAVLRFLGDLHFLSSARLGLCAAKAGNPSFVYYKTRPDPGARGTRLGSTHSSELPYLFGRTEPCLINPAGMDDAERAFGAQLMDYWSGFVKTGDPNSDNPTIPWPQYRDAFEYLDLGTEIHRPTEEETHILRLLDGHLRDIRQNSIRPFMDLTTLGLADIFQPF
jgi:para-nitrobenzyl esterase